MATAVHGPDHYESGRVAAWVAGGYAALVVGLALWIETLVLFGDPGFAGIWLILATLPSSVVLTALPVSGGVYLVLQTAGGLAQAWVLWRLLRGKRVR